MAFLTLAAGMLAFSPCAAQPSAQPQAPKLPSEQPYKMVPVSIGALPADPGFAAFRLQLAALAKSRVYADLARMVVSRGFFVEGAAFNSSASGTENLAAAIQLESAGGAGWNALAAFAAAPSAQPLPSRPGVLCAPAAPDFDLIDFDQLLAKTGTKANAWSYPRAANVPLRPTPRPGGPAVDMLGAHLVRVLANPDPANPAWALVAAPSGKTGFVPAAVLAPLQSARLCFQKDVTGRWQIAGYIAAAR